MYAKINCLFFPFTKSSLTKKRKKRRKNQYEENILEYTMFLIIQTEFKKKLFIFILSFMFIFLLFLFHFYFVYYNISGRGNYPTKL